MDHDFQVHKCEALHFVPKLYFKRFFIPTAYYSFKKLNLVLILLFLGFARM